MPQQASLPIPKTALTVAVVVFPMPPPSIEIPVVNHIEGAVDLKVVHMDPFVPEHSSMPVSTEIWVAPDVSAGKRTYEL